MGLNEGVNVFVDDDGKLTETTFYVPAYVRRYPYHARAAAPGRARSCRSASIRPREAIGEFEDGEPLFEDGEPTELTKNILEFNEQFEQAGAAHQRVHERAARNSTC